MTLKPLAGIEADVGCTGTQEARQLIACFACLVHDMCSIDRYYLVCGRLNMCANWYPTVFKALGLPHTGLLPIMLYHLLLLLLVQDKRVKDVMTPMNKVYMIEAGVRLNFEHMLEIYKSGYTRIPVYDKDPQNIIGILYTKDLILVDPGAPICP